MIRINLIQVQSPAGEPAEKVQDERRLAERKEFFPLVSLVASLAVVGFLYWSANHNVTRLNQQIGQARQEAARLAAIEAQNRMYQGQLAQINQHISVIQALQLNRTGPQELMTLLGNAIDRVNGLYLLSVDSSRGRLNIHGLSGQMNTIANFISTLQGIHSFNDVRLEKVVEADQKSRVSFQFDLDCLFEPPTAAPGPPSGAPAR
ncbi:MAG: PilN domain-containing protein [Terriglobia bacterium]